nr:protein VAC14 homolog isoform X2 [Physcomitrium patens]|eukprot:XP_024381913.1 protein VAC14 homolog isoform X2 [Physcomitrella patens]
MADSVAPLSSSVLRNLADKLYEKRKTAALEVESVVKSLTGAQDHEKISSIIRLLTNDFALSPQANHRKGGLIGLAAATVGLASEAAQHLEKIVPPVLSSFIDQDSRVRYYACEALYNIAKQTRIPMYKVLLTCWTALSRTLSLKVINSGSPQFSIEEFIPLLRERMNVLNPFVRQFLVGWITVLDSVPDIDMLGFLPDFLDGLFNMLSDNSHEIRQQADQALAEFLQEIKNAPSVDYGRMAEILVQRARSLDEFTRLTSITWVNEFVKLGGDQLVPYYAEILGVVLPAISDKEEKIRVVARETNEELQLIKAEPSEGFDIGAVLVIARGELRNESEATRLEALRWISVLLERHRTEVLSFLDDIFPALLKALSDSSDEVALLVLEVQACIARDPQHFRHLMKFLVHRFNSEHSLLERRGTLALGRLCQLLGAERVYRELATILEGEADLEFATIMVQALNLILLTAPELAELRGLLKETLSAPGGRDLFVALYSSWCHSSMATVSLCLLAQAYQHASSVIQSLGETDISVNLLVQVDKLVRLLETPIFAYLRLQLLEPGRYPHLLKALYGLLMLLPQQSSAFKILRTRLKTVPSHSFMHAPHGTLMPSEFPGLSAIRRSASVGPYDKILSHIAPMPTTLSLHATEDGEKVADSASNGGAGINFAVQLKQFEHMQQQHRMHRVVDSNLKPPRRPPIVSNQNGQRAEDRPDSQFPRGFASEARVPPQSPRSPWS